jgi:hypothetical protein
MTVTILVHPVGIPIGREDDVSIKILASYSSEIACKKAIDQIYLDEIHSGNQPDNEHRCIQIKLP